MRRGGRPVLAIEDLIVEFRSGAEVVTAADSVSYDVYPGETVGIVGESGSGKSVTVQAVLRLLAQPPAQIRGGRILFEDTRDLLTIPASEMRRIRGREISMVFQDPMASLNPVMSVGRQIGEAVRVHQPLSRSAARARAVELLQLVGIPDAALRARQFPHQFSGGMRQRVMVAMAVANRPKLIIADEPTTALDVTIQAQILEMLKTVSHETGAATILITHDLGLVAEMCDWVVVMYGGRVVETGSVAEIFRSPSHPYTVGLMQSIPRIDANIPRLRAIQGSPPSMAALPSGCSFHPRCALGDGEARCRTDVPQLTRLNANFHSSACHFAVSEVAGSARS